VLSMTNRGFVEAPDRERLSGPDHSSLDCNPGNAEAAGESLLSA